MGGTLPQRNCRAEVALNLTYPVSRRNQIRPTAASLSFTGLLLLGLLLPGMTANLEFVTETVKDALLVNNSAFRFRPTEEMLEEIKPRLIEKAKAMLPDSLQQNFNKALNNPETYAPANFKKRLPSNIDGFFYQDANGKLDFKFVQLGIKSGLQSEIKRFLDGNEMEVGSMAINSIKSKE